MLADILNMNGYGAYVWSTYGITLLVFGLNLFLSLRERAIIARTMSSRGAFSATRDLLDMPEPNHGDPSSLRSSG